MNPPAKRHHVDLQDNPVLPVTKRGKELLSDPLLNKGTGFPDSERDTLGLRGLVPPQVVSIDDQAQRALRTTGARTTTWSATSTWRPYTTATRPSTTGCCWSISGS